MSDLYTDAHIQAAYDACRAHWDEVYDGGDYPTPDQFAPELRAILGAVAPLIAARARQDALREAIIAHRDLHRIYGSTATCGGGIGGAMMTAHCGVVCNRGNHEAENTAWEAVEKSYFDGEATA